MKQGMLEQESYFSKQTQWIYVSVALTSLLISSYIDNLRGPLIPVIRAELDLAYGRMSWLLISGFVAALAFSVFSFRLFNNFSQRKIGALAGWSTIIACLLAVVVKDFFSLVVFGAVVGVAIAYLGTCCNVFIIKGTPPALHAKALAGMHTMYGIGSMIAAAAVGFGLELGLHWHVLLYVPVVATLGFLVLVRRMPEQKILEVSRHATESAPARKFLNKASISVIFCSCFYVGAEVMCSTWMSPYLVDYHHLSAEAASYYVFGYFAVLMFTRFLCFLFVKAGNENFLLKYSLVCSAFWYLLGYSGFLPGLFLAGILGPFFPLLIARASRSFAHQWHMLIVWIVTGMQIILCILHLSMGHIADAFGIKVAFFMPAILFALALFFLWLFFRWEKSYNQ